MSQDGTFPWREALRSPGGCLTPDDLEFYADAAPLSNRYAQERRAALANHLESCAVCQTELALFAEFANGQAAPHETAAVDWIERKLSAAPKPKARRWTSLRAPWGWRQATLALASLAFVVSIGWRVLEQREAGIQIDGSVSEFRSGRMQAIAPEGDLTAPPTELKWQAVERAAHYRVVILEVDGAELWAGECTQPSLKLASSTKETFVPGKTILWQAKAYDASGKVVGETGETSFRVKIAP